MLWRLAARLLSFPVGEIVGSAREHPEQRPDPLCAAGVEGDAAHLPQMALQHLWSSGENRQADGSNIAAAAQTGISKAKFIFHGVCVAAGCLILELVHAILNLSPEGEDQGR